MTGAIDGPWVDPGDPGQVEAVLAAALPGLGLDGVIGQLTGVAGLGVKKGRKGSLFRSEEPTLLWYGDRVLRWWSSAGPFLDHVVGGVVLSTDEVTPAALPGVLAALVTRAVQGSGARDQASVLLTSVRDAVSASS